MNDDYVLSAFRRCCSFGSAEVLKAKFGVGIIHCKCCLQYCAAIIRSSLSTRSLAVQRAFQCLATAEDTAVSMKFDAAK